MGRATYEMYLTIDYDVLDLWELMIVLIGHLFISE